MAMNTTFFYDEDTGRYIVKGARILFPNFEGAEQNYNQSGKRNFRLVITEGMADEMKQRGIYVRTMDPRDETEETQYTIKIGVYSDTDVRLLSGGKMTSVVVPDNDTRRNPDYDIEEDPMTMIDREFRKAHVKNGDISLEFHISRNTRVAGSSPYARLDTIVIPIRKSRLLADYEDMEMDEDEPF